MPVGGVVFPIFWPCLRMNVCWYLIFLSPRFKLSAVIDVLIISLIFFSVSAYFVFFSLYLCILPFFIFVFLLWVFYTQSTFCASVSLFLLLYCKECCFPY
uniref:Uncharacterized protein n=1 Tax=Cacopsylla melanoneura TaxID=428564 RepID=A0A8D8ZEY2_9HEMI